MKKQEQVKQHSGHLIHPNLDDYSQLCLMEAQSEHRKRGGNYSQSVLVRRAIRFYKQHMSMIDESGYYHERIETTRAAKGVQ